MVKIRNCGYQAAMTVLRPLLAILLALTLMMGSVASAVARSEMAGVTDVTLCGADGALTTLQLDASGNPVTPGHDCPHCLAAGAVAVLSGPALTPGLTGVRSALVLPGLTGTLPPAQTLAPLARGPPPLV